MFENELIERIRKILPAPSSRVFVGIGDDAAVVLPPRRGLVATTDAMVEGVHFDFGFCKPFDVGFKCVHVNVSDLAAQGAWPQSILISLALPQNIDPELILEMYRGISQAAQKFKIDIIGGNITKNPPGLGGLSVHVTALGEVFDFLKINQTPQRGRAHADEWIGVTGPLGMAGAGLMALQRLGRTEAEHRYPQCVQRYLRPQARLHEVYNLLKTNAVTSMMDISDGLLMDLSRLRGSTSIDFVLDRLSLNPHPEIQQIALDFSLSANDVLDMLLSSGDDYELIATVDPEKWREAVIKELSLKDLLHFIGETHETSDTNSTGLYLQSERGERITLQPKGWDHFNT